MAVISYQLTSCADSSTTIGGIDNFYNVQIGGYYYLDFATTATTDGCYFIVGTSREPYTNSVIAVSSQFGSCSACSTNPTPTPTATVTPTPSITPSVTPTQTNTPTNSATPTQTGTPNVTPTRSGTPTPTPTNTGTPNVTPTPTQTVTPTKTATPTITPSPTPSPYALTGGTTNTNTGTINYEDCINCSGSTTTSSLPHAIYSNGQGRAVVQADSVALGGPNGLNS
jgi:hypothetical protein